MKIGITTTLSIAGVLAAGAAAFAINTSVLSAANNSPTTAVADLKITDTALVTPGGVSAQDMMVTKVQVSGTNETYTVGVAGTVVVDTASGAVVVTSIAPSAGWTSEPARTEANGIVKVHFIRGESRIEFTAQLTNGAVQTAVIDESGPISSQPAIDTPSGSATPGKPTLPPTIRGGDDDDDDQEHHSGDSKDNDGDDD